MKVEQSGINYNLPRIRIAHGEGKIEPFEGYIEIVFAGYDIDTGGRVIYQPAKIRVNMSTSTEQDVENVTAFIELLQTAVSVATGDLKANLPDNVLSERAKVMDLLQNA